MTVIHSTNNHSSDILVVGAGPAGISAAECLTRKGAGVTLIERHAVPGTKACGGGLTRSAWNLAGMDPSRPARGAEAWREMEIRSPLGHITISTTQTQLITFDRRLWIAERIQNLRDMGANIALGERFLSLGPTSRNEAITTHRKRCFGCLIGADGAASRVRKQIGLGHGSHVRGWQIKLSKKSAVSRGLRLNRPVIWFEPSLFKSGYAWAFPYRDELRVGCGAGTSAFDGKTLKRRFFEWLSRKRISPDMGLVQAGTIGCDYLGHRFGNLFLAGDAAGLASPLTGEGIYQALASGREVAREILESDYHSKKVSQLATRHRRTHDALSHPFLFKTLYAITPYLLKYPPIRSAAWERYVY